MKIKMENTKNKKMLTSAFAGLVLSVSGFAHAGLINGGSDIIDQNDLTQLGSWLGNGDIDLTNIFTKTGTQNSVDWHAAVDGKGATFTLIEAIYNNNTFIFGGYNDYSWNSSTGYNTVDYNVDNSFLFSLTNNVKLERSRFPYSTYNHSNYGATFGGGHDLYIDSDLATGYSNLGHSYGDTSAYRTTTNRNLLAGTFNGWQIQKYETFTVNQATPRSEVPEPSTLAIFALGVIGLAARKFKKH